MLRELPAWIVPNDVSVEAEVAGVRGLGAEERLRQSRALCREAALAIAARPDPSRWWGWVDPLPPSTVEVLRRLGMRAPGMP